LFMDDRPLGKRIKYAIIYYFVRFLIFASNLFPRRTWLAVCGFLGGVAWYFSTQSRKLALAHLKIAFGKEKTGQELLKLSKETFRMLGKNAGDVLRAKAITTLSEIEKYVVVEGYENYENANAKGKGIVFIASHLGAFDLQVTIMSLKGWRPTVVGAPLNDPRLNELVYNYRNAYGAVVLERGKETMQLLRTLKKGGMVALLIDQDTKVKSEFVDFFGQPASTPVGASVLALKTSAAVVPISIYLGEDNLQHVQIFPEIIPVITDNEGQDVIAITQRCTTFIEEQIRLHPTQWVWMHERWKTKPVR
jgi:Kdo2-lipid IVA lauroyltransferase/acyltransferase